MIQAFIVGETDNLLYFSDAFLNALLFGVMPPLAFALFGKMIPRMTEQLFASCRLFFVGYVIAIVALPLKTGYAFYDVTLLVIAVFVAGYLLFCTEDKEVISPRD